MAAAAMASLLLPSTTTAGWWWRHQLRCTVDDNDRHNCRRHGAKTPSLPMRMPLCHRCRWQRQKQHNLRHRHQLPLSLMTPPLALYPTTASVDGDHRRQSTKTAIAAAANNCRHQPPPKLLTTMSITTAAIDQRHYYHHHTITTAQQRHHHHHHHQSPLPLDRRWLYPTAASDDNDSHPCPHCPSHCPPSEEDQTAGWRARCGACHSSSPWLLLLVSSLLSPLRQQKRPSCQYLRPGRGGTPQPHRPCACRQLSPALLNTDATPHVTISAGPLHVVHIVLNLIVVSFGGGGGG